MPTQKSISALFVALLAFIVFSALPTGEYVNPVSHLLKTLTPYLPGHPVPGCDLIYYSGSVSGCVLYHVPGTSQVALTVNAISGEINGTFVTLHTAVSIGDLMLEYGAYERTRRGAAWQWEWESGVLAFKYSTVGYPSKLTQVTMLSWRQQ